MIATILPHVLNTISSAVFSEGTPTNAEPYTLPGWQALLLLVGVVTVLVLALYWNTRVYQAPEVSGAHGGEPGHTPEH